MGPLITCGVTSFNAENTIERAVKSALAQRYRPIEIVVVDDSSTDRTLKALEQLASKHQEIRVFCQSKNGGVAAARNRIIGEARGEFVAFFDDDDESLPGRVEAQLMRIVDYERCFAGGAPVVCHTARRVIYPGGVEAIQAAMGTAEATEVPFGPVVARHILIGETLPMGGYGAAATCSQMARTRSYKDIGSFDESFRRCEDTEFDVRAALAGAHFVGVATPEVVQTMTRTRDKSVASEHGYMLMVLEKHRDYLEENGAYFFARRFLNAKYAFIAGRYDAFALNTAAAVALRPGLALRRLVLSLRNAGLNRRMGRFLSTPSKRA